MEQILQNLQSTSQLSIDKKPYHVLAKARYRMGKGGEYVKVFLNDDYALVDFLEDNGTLLFVKNYGAILPEFPTPATFSFQGEEYEQVNADHQFLEEIYFGEQGQYEGNLDFIDYEGKEKKNLFISIGFIPEMKARADLAGQFVDIEQIFHQLH